MPHPVYAEKRRTALEVDQHQIEDVRGMSRNHAEDQGAQEFRLSGTCSAHTQAMRTHAVSRRLFDIEFHSVTEFGHTDRNSEVLPVVPRAPSPCRIDAFGSVEPHQGN